MRRRTQIARLLRRRSTPVEHIVWRWLRHRYLAGFKFRRQHPVGSYVLDFYCPRLKLAIELDGIGHDQPRQQSYDSERTEELKREGIVCVRLRNEVVLENPDGAWEMITMAVARIHARRENKDPEAMLRSLLAESSPLSPPQRGEG